MKIIARVSSTLILLGLSFSALATETCTDAQRTNNLVCLNGVGAGTYGFDNARIAAGNLSMSTHQGGEEERRLSQLGNSNLSGLAAGDHLSGWGFWGSFNHTNFQANLPINAAIGRVRYDGDTNSVLFGADYAITERLVAGVALGYEDTEVFTFYNGGNNDSDGYTIAPYAAFLINNYLSIDVAAGYTQLEYDTDRVSLASAGTTNLGSFDSDRWFASANLNAFGQVGPFAVSGRIGYLYTEEEQDAYQETGGADARAVSDRNIDLAQMQLGFEAAYTGFALMPYAGVTYAKDLSRDTGGSGLQPGLPGGVAPSFVDETELQVGFGLRHYGEMISVMLDIQTILEREDFDSHSAMLTIRADL